MIEKAKAFATKAHQGQKRKKSNMEYIVHPIRVADYLQASGFRKEVVSAGYLHDVVEDTPYTIEDIEKEFGEDVAHIVASHTEDKTESWIKRKQHTIDVVKESSLEVKALIVADKLDNLQSLQQEIEREGMAVWDDFNAGYDKQKWYYKSIAEVMEAGIDSTTTPPYFQTYHQLVKQTFD